MRIFLDEALDLRLAKRSVDHAEIEPATIEGAVHRLRPKLMTVFVVILSLAPIFFEAGSVGNDVMEPIAVPIVGGMVTSSIAVLILLPVLFAMIKERELRKGMLRPSAVAAIEASFDQRR
jgi:copper/silver efflux system protein